MHKPKMDTKAINDIRIEEHGDRCYKGGNYQEALSCYQEALKYSPEQATLNVKIGDSLRKQGAYDEALRAYSDAIKIGPPLAAAYNGMCYTYLELGRFKAAQEIHAHAFALDPQCAPVYNSKGRIRYEEKKYTEALEAFDQAILLATEKDNLAGFYYNKGLTLQRLQHFDEALEAYYQAYKLGLNKPTSADLRKDIPKKNRSKKIDKTLEEAHELVRLQDYQGALNTFTFLLLLDEHHGQAHMGKGDVLMALGFHKDAASSFAAASGQLSHDPQLFVKKGQAYLQCEKYTKAQRSFEKAISLLEKGGNSFAPHKTISPVFASDDILSEKELGLSIQAHAGKGHAHYTLNEKKAALQAYIYAIHYGTDDANCYNNAGTIRAGQEKYRDARKFYKQAIELAPSLISAQFGLGDVLMRMKQDEAAAEVYHKALAFLQTSHSPETLWSLITLVLASSRPANIQFELLQQFISQAPQDTRCFQIFKELGKRSKQLFDPQFVADEELKVNVQKFAQMLQQLPITSRAEALATVVPDHILTVHMLILLAPFSIVGLSKFIHQLITQLKPERTTSDLLTTFYLTLLDSYSVSEAEADWLYAQILFIEQRPTETRSVLSKMAQQTSEPDIYWLLLQTLEQLRADPQEQLATIKQFMSIASPADERWGQAWEQSGQLYEQINNGMEAVNSYAKAREYGRECPKYADYHKGYWNSIRGLDTHADFAFPPVIVIDLESEYRPGAPLGSTVFEVGAVCMKGSTELATYEAVIQREFIAQKVKDRQHLARPVEQAMAELRTFIEDSQQDIEKAIIVGHNFQAFDAPHLRALGLPITDDQIIDTLTFARLLHPDSIHHNLSLLCEHYHIPLEQAHNALPDTRACAQLLYALGEELITRGEHFLAGFRAFVPVESAFDRAILQPRKCAASPDCDWELNPAPVPAQVLSPYKDASPSPQILHTLQTGGNALIERFDPYGDYASELPCDCRTVVVVATRVHLEQLLAATWGRNDLFVLPDPRTLLCPHRLRESIEREEDPQVQLALFCLYQATHNHDAGTLYPLRLYFKRAKSSEPGENTPGDDVFIQKLRQLLLAACCASDREHVTGCQAHQIAREASVKSTLVLATHENFLHQPRQLHGDRLIVDDIDDLQMHFAEHLANRVAAQEIETSDKNIYDLLNAFLNTYVAQQQNKATLHERLPLSRVASSLTQPQNGQEKSTLDLLKEQGQRGEIIAKTLEYFCDASSQPAKEGYVHAYWLDLVFSAEQIDSRQLEHWDFYGIHEDLRLAFLKLFWHPFRQRILCGTAVTLGGTETQFLRRFFGIPTDVPFLADEKKAVQVYIPDEETILPSSFLARRRWAESAGAFLYRLARVSQESIAVTLHSSPILEALARAFNTNWQSLQRRTLSPYLGWASTRINDYLNEENEQLPIAFLSPRQRKAALNNPVGIEVTGPLRFLHQQDPLVAAQMRAFVTQKDASKDGPFTAYLLPQALLELKARTASQADLHIILDSALNHATYRDEVSNLFGGKVQHTLPRAI